MTPFADLAAAVEKRAAGAQRLLFALVEPELRAHAFARRAMLAAARARLNALGITVH